MTILLTSCAKGTFSQCRQFFAIARPIYVGPLGACTEVGPAWACLTGEHTHSDAVFRAQVPTLRPLPPSRSLAEPQNNKLTSDRGKESVGDCITLYFHSVRPEFFQSISPSKIPKIDSDGCS